MRERAADWLPPGCIESAAVARPFADAVAQWAEHWFAAEPWSAVGGWQSDDAVASGGGWTALRSAPQLTLLGTDRAALRTASAVLGLPEQQRYTEADLRVLRRLASRVFDDLEQRIAALVGIHGGGASGFPAQYVLMIGPGDSPVIALRCNAAQLIPVARRAFPALLDKTALADRLSACDDHRVPIAAVLGSANLTIEQIAQFEVGDVIVLDQSSDDPVPLAIADNPTAMRCLLGERSGQIILEVMETA